MLGVISKIPYYYLFRLFGWPRKLPMNLTFSVSFKCNARCKTCNIHKKKRSNELSVEEWKKVFKGIGKDLFWATISGGEPFLRNNLSQIVSSLYDACGPAVINIPTNGLLNRQIPAIVDQIAAYCRNAQIVINLSLDEIFEAHDAIRGIRGNYTRALSTLQGLKSLGRSNLSVGIHTVISRFNVHRIPTIYRHLRSLNPDSYITEIAEERMELETIGANITPDYNHYARAANFLIRQLKRDRFNRVGKITRAFRIQYYQLVKQTMREHCRQIPCYAGFASAQVAPDGSVWLCCMKAQSVGNLRDVGYDFKRVWFSEKADRWRSRAKASKCFCPLANASYTNMLHDPKSLAKAAWNFIHIK